ncbi:MAG: MBL fold metallo-hydrolase [Actinomycetales bacterium]|nr:MAG: MBL fold metallo-hydrolase [Actinomycetales bacterium]
MCQVDAILDPQLIPREAPGEAVDPIGLEPVDEVSVTTLVDNVYDGLLTDSDGVTRTPMQAHRPPARHFDTGYAWGGLRAEHGFAALVTVRRGESTWRVLFDTGLTPDGMIDNADRMQIDLRDVQAVLLSHGHFDHAGGLLGLGERLAGRSTGSMPLVLHPFAFTPRRLAVPGSPELLLPTLSRAAVEAEGFAVIDRRVPSLLLDGSLLLTGEVDRTTDFELGMPPVHEAFVDGAWGPDRTVIDDQALVVNVRGQGLVIVTGCGHAGTVNIARHAMRLTGVPKLAGMLGGFHLNGPAFAPVIEPTVSAFVELDPQLVVAGHCTGFAAQARLAAALPTAYLPGSSGSTYTVRAG